VLYRPPWRIELTIRAGVPRLLSDAAVARAVDRALVAGGAPSPAAIGLIFADDREIEALNRSAMGHDGPTDVLSFPQLSPASFPDHPGRRLQSGAAPEPGFVMPGRRTHLGDVVVSVERAIEQADQGRGGQTGDVRWQPADELRLLVTHGVLHICGWDHAERVEEAAMRELEKELLA
jgi:probable rRNA maturation factor